MAAPRSLAAVTPNWGSPGTQALSSCLGAASAGGAASTLAEANIVSSATPQAMRKPTRARTGNETRRLMNKRPPSICSAHHFFVGRHTPQRLAAGDVDHLARDE